MIYKDKYSIKDSNDMPRQRDDDSCLNCNQSYYDHNGWACESKGETRFNMLSHNERYLTQSMQNSVNGSSVAQPATKRPKVTKQDIKEGFTFLVGRDKRKGKVVYADSRHVQLEINNGPGDTQTYNWTIETMVGEFDLGFFHLPFTTTTQVKPMSVDISDWRVWRKKSDTECPCGIHRAQCSYHKQ